MCYSAKIEADYRRYVREFGAVLSLKDFTDLFWRRHRDSKIKIPKAMEAPFAEPRSDAELPIKTAIDEFHAEETARLEQELFKQRKRLADAERTLGTKTIKAASESKRIASEKIDRAISRLADLRRSDLKDRDSRIFPGYYAPVMVMENGRLVVKPMRYQCRPAGKPAFYDTKYPGTYNARRDNLTGFWKQLFGYTHGIVSISAFFENVDRHRVEGRALRDGEPPAEVAAAGHDRCIIPIKRENILAWLNHDPADLDALFAILDNRERPRYEHRFAA